MDDRALLVHHPEVDNGIHLDGDVVLRNDILGWYVHCYGTQADTDQSIDERHDDDESRTVAAIEASRNATKPKNHAPFVFAEDIEGQLDNYEHKDGEQQEADRNKHYD